MCNGAPLLVSDGALTQHLSSRMEYLSRVRSSSMRTGALLVSDGPSLSAFFPHVEYLSRGRRHSSFTRDGASSRVLRGCHSAHHCASLFTWNILPMCDSLARVTGPPSCVRQGFHPVRHSAAFFMHASALLHHPRR
jgi:hypothetical protein